MPPAVKANQNLTQTALAKPHTVESFVSLGMLAPARISVSRATISIVVVRGPIRV